MLGISPCIKECLSTFEKKITKAGKLQGNRVISLKTFVAPVTVEFCNTKSVKPSLYLTFHRLGTKQLALLATVYLKHTSCQLGIVPFHCWETGGSEMLSNVPNALYLAVMPGHRLVLITLMSSSIKASPTEVLGILCLGRQTSL